MTNLLVTLRSLLLLAARLLLYMGIALLAVAAMRMTLANASVLIHHLTSR